MKQVVKQPRPYTCKALDTCDTFGWPSSHSQFSCFFSVYMALLAFYHLQFSEPFLRVVVIALLCLFAPTVMYSRVYLGYHTVGQVYAGAVVGITLGCLWYRIVNSVIAGHFVTLEKSAFCRRFLISYNKSCKDLTPSKNVKGGEKKSTKEGKQIVKVRKLGRPLKRVSRAF
jgi:dolichyldiphosphatase